MHCIVATDGSQASLVGARQFKWIADSREITDVTVVAVVSPYAAVPFANELGPQRRHRADRAELRRGGRRSRSTSSRRSSTAGGRPSTSRSAAAPRPKRSSGRPRIWTPT